MTKTTLNLEYDIKDTPSCMEYTPDGECLIVCFHNSYVRFFELIEEDEIENAN